MDSRQGIDSDYYTPLDTHNTEYWRVKVIF